MSSEAGQVYLLPTPPDQAPPDRAFAKQAYMEIVPGAFLPAVDDVARYAGHARGHGSRSMISYPK